MPDTPVSEHRARGPAVRVVGLDHIVLSCADVERSLAFYTTLLGLTSVRVEEFRRGEAPFPSVRVTAGTMIDLFPAAAEGSSSRGRVHRNLDHFCLEIEPCDLHELAASGSFEVVGGPTDHLFGAQGYATSLYVRDPDGNVVELRGYAPPLL
jgi:catechol 2,3-dioxygenase-like lactoylglutathione lyase family enzyme